MIRHSAGDDLHWWYWMSFYKLFEIESMENGNALIKFSRYKEIDEVDEVEEDYYYFRREFEYHVELDLLERR